MCDAHHEAGTQEFGTVSGYHICHHSERNGDFVPLDFFPKVREFDPDHAFVLQCTFQVQVLQTSCA